MKEDKVKSFFNKTSINYKKKYDFDNVLLNYFFHQRLNIALQDYDFNDKKVLDIGAGTGNLYDEILKKYPKVIYTAVDISEGMLENSLIPPSKRFVGNCYDVELPYSEYDYIYMLGVTTYLSDENLSKTLLFIANKLNSNHGKLIVTFTQKKTLDNTVRSILKFPIRLFGNKNKVLSQKFEINKKSTLDVEKLFNSNNLKIEKSYLLNQTFFPLNLLFPKLSIRFGNFLLKKFKSKKVLNFFSSDLLYMASVKDR